MKINSSPLVLSLILVTLSFAASGPISSLHADDVTFVPLALQTNDSVLPGGMLEALAFSLPPSPQAYTPSDSPSLSTNFAGSGDTIFNPPDTMGAVGPNHLMVMLNGEVRIQDRSGTTLSTTNLNGWWAAAGPFASFVFDPRLLYDPFNDRWIAVALSDARSSASALLIAVSGTGDPTGQWYRYRYYVDASAQYYADFPYVGFNKDKVVVGWNYRTISTDTSYTAGLALVNKQTLYSGTTPVLNSTITIYKMNPGAVGDDVAPAITYDTNQSNVYLMRVFDRNSAGKGHLVVYALGGTVTAPTLTTNGYAPAAGWAATGYTPSQPNFVPQLGIGQRIDTGDDRLAQVYYRFGALWCVHTIFLPASSPTHSVIQWWQINPPDANVLQRGTLEDTSATTNYAYPSIAVNKFQDVLVGFASFSSNQYASASYSFHAYTNSAGMLQSPALLKAGVSSFWRTNSNAGNTDLRNRWGDYSATVVDPVNDTDLWTIQEYAAQYFGTLTNQSGRWGTWWGKLALPTPPNDNLTNAITISGTQGATNGTTVRATRESGEPYHAGNTNSLSVWYQWTPPTNGSVTLDITNALGNSQDTILATYTGTVVSGLTLVASNHGGLAGSKLVFTATTGTTYRIAVAGFNGTSGDFGLDWFQPTAPVFTSQPHGFDVLAGSNITFSATAIGTPDPSYQWNFNGTNISGANSSAYTKNNVQTNDSGNYTVTATNTSGSLTSAVAHLQVYISATPILSEPSFFSNQFQFLVSGITGSQYVVEVSTNLINWTSIATNITTFTNIDRDVTNYPQRFYRGLYQP